MIAPLSADRFSVLVELVSSERPSPSDRATSWAAAHAAARRTRNGRPHLDGIAAFGVSHTGCWTAYILANRKYVGVDLELQLRPDVAGLERRLGRAVAGSDEVEVDFLSRWVLKEACVKGLGLRLLSTLRHVRLRTRHFPEQAREDARLFTVSIGRIGMVAMALDIGFGLLGIAYRDTYEPPSLRLVIDGCVR
ncbi:MAG: 4-phosphopantetheinyl transferase [Aliidongia sp.]|jgi:4'-phosphopantetheinyl transferase|nr:4-phosphopantetheinyl transferase [Aliidongia sp.]